MPSSRPSLTPTFPKWWGDSSDSSDSSDNAFRSRGFYICTMIV